MNEITNDSMFYFSFSLDLDVLAKVPLLAALIDNGQSEGEEENEQSNESSKDELPKTLLEWISSKDQQSSLQQVAEQCRRGLEQVYIILLIIL